MRQTAFFALALCVVALTASPAGAVVAPPSTPADFTGQWTGTNWSMSTVGVFEWMAGSADAISPYSFLTARHLNSTVGEVQDIDGQSYTVLSVKVIPEGSVGADMTLVTVDKPLPVEWETMYTGTYTQGQKAIMIGYGIGGQTYHYGFSWDYSIPRAERWGTNEVYMTLAFGDDVTSYTQGFAMLYTSTDTDYEAGVSDGDSGGGVFVKVGNRWELAGLPLEVLGSGDPLFDGTLAGDVSHYSNWIIDNTTIPGDANMDLKVNFQDYLALEAGFGKSGASWYTGDFNHDGKVNFADYLLLEANFGKSAYPAGATILPSSTDTSGGMVPEPATIALLLAGGIGILRRK